MDLMKALHKNPQEGEAAEILDLMKAIQNGKVPPERVEEAKKIDLVLVRMEQAYPAALDFDLCDPEAYEWAVNWLLAIYRFMEFLRDCRQDRIDEVTQELESDGLSTDAAKKEACRRIDEAERDYFQGSP